MEVYGTSVVAETGLSYKRIISYKKKAKGYSSNTALSADGYFGH